MIIDFSKASLQIVFQTILEGGIISFPTDTLYALSCDATNIKAVDRLFSIKKRSIQKTTPIMIKSTTEAFKHVHINDKAQKILEKFWPGALTMVLPVKNDTCIADICIRNSTLALRVPNHTDALGILNYCNLPLIATSVNYEGCDSLNDAEIINEFFGDQIDVIVKSKESSYNLPSTIISLENSKINIIREGAISSNDINCELSKHD